jgi:toxin ParE1/3/4
MDGMKQRWLSSALADLDRVYEHISQGNSKAARHVFTRIRNATKNLKRFPESGRAGHVQGTRELLVTGLPYLLVYRITGDTIEILRVLHTSQDLGNPYH